MLLAAQLVIDHLAEQKNRWSTSATDYFSTVKIE